MSSEHSREVLREIAMETSDEGNVPGRSSTPGLLVAIAAVVAVVLICLAMANAPSRRDQPPASAMSPSAQQ